MAPRSKRKRKDGIPRATRKRRAALKKAGEMDAERRAAARSGRWNALKAFGRRTAAALFVCGALAIGIRGDTSTADSGRGRADPTRKEEKKPAGSAERERERKIAVLRPFKKSREGAEAVFKEYVYAERLAVRESPWEGAEPLVDNTLKPGTENSGGRDSGGEGRMESGMGRSEAGKGGKKKPRREPRRRDWDHLYMLPEGSRRGFKMDPLDPEGEDEKKG